MASSFKRLYIGVASDLGVRVRQHKEHRYPNNFTSRYHIDHLNVRMIEDAIARETQLKKWSQED
jgi:predicted GIY-YIG superfamily endonuclease